MTYEEVEHIKFEVCRKARQYSHSLSYDDRRGLIDGILKNFSEAMWVDKDGEVQVEDNSKYAPHHAKMMKIMWPLLSYKKDGFPIARAYCEWVEISDVSTIGEMILQALDPEGDFHDMKRLCEC